MKNNFSFDAKIWLYPGETAAWHFVSVPKKESGVLHEIYKGKRRGWNSIRVEVRIGKTTWNTSIFFDRKGGQYLLPLKQAVRRAEGVLVGDKVKIKLTIV